MAQREGSVGLIINFRWVETGGQLMGAATEHAAALQTAVAADRLSAATDPAASRPAELDTAQRVCARQFGSAHAPGINDYAGGHPRCLVLTAHAYSRAIMLPCAA